VAPLLLPPAAAACCLLLAAADKLIEATPQNIVTCMQWVNDDLSARGTTDISGPLQRALRMLVGAPGLPSVFLITDGALCCGAMPHAMPCMQACWARIRLSVCLAQHSASTLVCRCDVTCPARVQAAWMVSGTSARQLRR
jgi:hypothetical protein